MISRLTIGGFPCRLTRPLKWSLYTGTNARVTEFPMNREDAEKILNSKSPGQGGGSSQKIATVERGVQPPPRSDGYFDLIMEGSGGKKVECKKLVIVGEGRPTTPYERVIQVSDQRYFWPNVAVGRSFNDVISSLSTRAVLPTGEALINKDFARDQTFAYYSMNDGDPWNAETLLKAVLEKVVGEENKDWKINVDLKKRRLPDGLVQNVDIENNGATALAIALGLNSGVNIYQDYDGRIVVDGQLPGEADSIIKSLGDLEDNGRLVIGLGKGGNCLRKIDRSRDRSKVIDSLFTIEAGVRSDYKTGINATDEDFWMKPVLQTTDPSTELTDDRTVGPGTTYDQVLLLQKWNEIMAGRAPSIIIAQYPLNEENINLFYLRNMNNVWTKGSVFGYAVDPVVARYVSEIKRSYRLLYQVNPRYANGAKAIISKVPGIVDPETGTEARAIVYQDYAIKPSAVAFARTRNGKIKELIVNVDGGVDPYWTGNAGRLSGAERAPFDISVESRAGLLRFAPYVDPWGEQDRIVQSKLEEDTIPSGDYQATVASFARAKLENTHSANAVFTMVPGPRDESVYYRIRITPQEVEKAFNFKIGECRGPLWEEFVGYNLQPAKFPYTDENYEELKKLFGVIPSDGKHADLGTPLNEDVLKDIALNKAMAYYQQKLDRWSGQIVTILKEGIVPRGEIQTVTHILTPSGTMFTSVVCGIDDNSAFDSLAGLSASARRQVLRQVNPTGA